MVGNNRALRTAPRGSGLISTACRRFLLAAVCTAARKGGCQPGNNEERKRDSVTETWFDDLWEALSFHNTCNTHNWAQYACLRAQINRHGFAALSLSFISPAGEKICMAFCTADSGGFSPRISASCLIFLVRRRAMTPRNRHCALTTLRVSLT